MSVNLQRLSNSQYSTRIYFPIFKSRRKEGEDGKDYPVHVIGQLKYISIYVYIFINSRGSKDSKNPVRPHSYMEYLSDYPGIKTHVNG